MTASEPKCESIMQLEAEKTTLAEEVTQAKGDVCDLRTELEDLQLTHEREQAEWREASRTQNAKFVDLQKKAAALQQGLFEAHDAAMASDAVRTCCH